MKNKFKSAATYGSETLPSKQIKGRTEMCLKELCPEEHVGGPRDCKQRPLENFSLPVLVKYDWLIVNHRVIDGSSYDLFYGQLLADEWL